MTAKGPSRHPDIIFKDDNRIVTITTDRQILIVDDDRRLTDVMGTVLKLEGFGVVCVHSAEDALAALRGPTFHLIILDVMLPGVDGVQVCRHLRERGISAAPILMCTALTDPHIFEEARAAGVTHFMSKPFNLMAFVAAVRQCLGEGDSIEASAPESGRPTLEPAVDTGAPPDAAG